MQQTNSTQESCPFIWIWTNTCLKRSLNPILLNPLLNNQIGKNAFTNKYELTPKTTQVLQHSPQTLYYIPRPPSNMQTPRNAASTKMKSWREATGVKRGLFPENTAYVPMVHIVQMTESLDWPAVVDYFLRADCT